MILRYAILPLAVLVGCSNGQANEGERIDLCDYELFFSDEFDDLAVGKRELEEGLTWTAHTPWNGDFGDAVFIDPREGFPFAVKDGILTITAARNEKGRWRSGLIAAADASGKGSGLQYGYFEARMKFPPGPGTWPAFWLMSLKPQQVRPKIEIDVIEYYGHMKDRFFMTAHVWWDGVDNSLTRGKGTHTTVPDGSLVDDFNRYGVLVEPEDITFFLNGEAVWTTPTPAEHNAPLYPLVNLALGSGYSIEDTPDPSVMEVDYVRIYRPLPNSAERNC